MKKAIITSIILLLISFPQTPVSVLGQDSGMASIRAIAWSPDSTKLVVSDLTGQIYIVDVLTGEILITLQEGNIEDVALTVAWSPDGTKIAAGGRQMIVQIYDASTGDLMFNLEDFSPDETGNVVVAVSWSPENGLAGATWSGSPFNFIIWDGNTGQTEQVMKSVGDIYSLQWNPFGDKLASTNGRSISLWNEDSVEMQEFLEGSYDDLIALDWHPNNIILAGSDASGQILIWDTISGEMINTWEAHADATWSLDWNPDGSQLMSASWDGSVRVWNLETNHYAELLPPNEHVIYTAAWSPNGEYIAYGGAYHTLSIVPAPTDFPLETPITND